MPFTSTDRSAAPLTGFDALPPTSGSHFKLCFLGAVLHVLGRLAANLGSNDELVEQFPFLRDYLAELEQLGGIDTPSDSATSRWLHEMRRWEAGVETHLPVRALRHALDLDERAVTLLFAIGLIEEDPRFGFLIESAQPFGQQHRPTLGLLTAWWRDDRGVSGVRESIGLLLDHGLVQALNADAPRLQWAFQSPAAVWDALRGDASSAPMPGVTFRRLLDLPTMAGLVLPDHTMRLVERAPAVLASGDARALVVRGPRGNGRRTIARAVAAALGRGVLEVRGPLRPDDDRWPVLGALATLRHAMPLVCLDLGLGDTCELPRPRGYDGPVAVVVGRHGAVGGEGVEGAISISIGMPGVEERRRLWRRSLTDGDDDQARVLGERFRMTSGAICSVAPLSQSQAALEGRRRIVSADVRAASRGLHREIERLATPVPVSGGWECMAAAAETFSDLRSLESRCRHRERLHAHVGPALAHQVNCGVRALFAGPSGTGKTMAARLLASTLQMDLYRLDLASVVNKYIGETEKSLDQLFSRAEELDVLLLIDEGDALLTNRTSVQSSNDRYANLETNYLLQRLESYEGILVVTTNAASRIDAAFERRMDVVVEFRMPAPHERWLIWQLHLPLEHGVDQTWLQEAAVRCELSGGQIRNAVLQASLAALDESRTPCTRDLDRAIQREYRKTGTVCPLPSTNAIGG